MHFFLLLHTASVCIGCTAKNNDDTKLAASGRNIKQILQQSTFLFVMQILNFMDQKKNFLKNFSHDFNITR